MGQLKLVVNNSQEDNTDQFLLKFSKIESNNEKIEKLELQIQEAKRKIYQLKNENEFISFYRDNEKPLSDKLKVLEIKNERETVIANVLNQMGIEYNIQRFVRSSNNHITLAFKVFSLKSDSNTILAAVASGYNANSKRIIYAMTIGYDKSAEKFYQEFIKVFTADTTPSFLSPKCPHSYETILSDLTDSLNASQAEEKIKTKCLKKQQEQSNLYFLPVRPMKPEPKPEPKPEVVKEPSLINKLLTDLGLITKEVKKEEKSKVVIFKQKETYSNSDGDNNQGA